MIKTRVYEVARELGLDNRELVTKLASLGIPVRNHMSSIDPADADRVKRAIEKEKQQNVVEERIRPTVVRRRTVRREGDGEAAEPVAVAAAPEPAPVRGAAGRRVRAARQAPAAGCRHERRRARRHPNAPAAGGGAPPPAPAAVHAPARPAPERAKPAPLAAHAPAAPAPRQRRRPQRRNAGALRQQPRPQRRCPSRNASRRPKSRWRTRAKAESRTTRARLCTAAPRRSAAVPAAPRAQRPAAGRGRARQSGRRAGHAAFGSRALAHRVRARRARRQSRSGTAAARAGALGDRPDRPPAATRPSRPRAQDGARQEGRRRPKSRRRARPSA